MHVQAGQLLTLRTTPALDYSLVYFLSCMLSLEVCWHRMGWHSCRLSRFKAVRLVAFTLNFLGKLPSAELEQKRLPPGDPEETIQLLLSLKHQRIQWTLAWPGTFSAWREAASILSAPFKACQAVWHTRGTNHTSILLIPVSKNKRANNAMNLFYPLMIPQASCVRQLVHSA